MVELNHVQSWDQLLIPTEHELLCGEIGGYVPLVAAPEVNYGLGWYAEDAPGHSAATFRYSWIRVARRPRTP